MWYIFAISPILNVQLIFFFLFCFFKATITSVHMLVWSHQYKMVLRLFLFFSLPDGVKNHSHSFVSSAVHHMELHSQKSVWAVQKDSQLLFSHHLPCPGKTHFPWARVCERECFIIPVRNLAGVCCRLLNGLNFHSPVSWVDSSALHKFYLNFCGTDYIYF